MSALLRFAGVACRRGGRLLFDELDLELKPGESLHLSGPNGSGKSSLIRIAAGLLRPDAGRVERAGVALADEHPALDRERPLREALLFWARLSGSGRRVDAAMDALGLTHLAQVPVRLLSAGQLKRAAVARVAASPALLWLLDEPWNALDTDGAARLDAAIAAHCAAGGAVLATSHGPVGGDWQRLDLAA